MYFGLKVMEGFSVIGNLAVTMSTEIRFYRAIFVLRQIFELKQGIKSALRCKNYFQFTIW